MDFDDFEDDSRSARPNVAALLSRLSMRHGVGRDHQAAAPAETLTETLAANRVSLSRHLAKLRASQFVVLNSDVRIVHYTCSSAAVAAVLDMLSDMFK